MSAPLLTPAQLGDLLGGLTAADVDRLRQKHKWPHVRLGRFEVRFTEAQVDAIVASHTVKPDTKAAAPAAAIPGQTSRSAKRSA